MRDDGHTAEDRFKTDSERLHLIRNIGIGTPYPSRGIDFKRKLHEMLLSLAEHGDSSLAKEDILKVKDMQVVWRRNGKFIRVVELRESAGSNFVVSNIPYEFQTHTSTLIDSKSIFPPPTTNWISKF